MTQIVLQERTARALGAQLSLALVGWAVAFGALAQQAEPTQAQHLPTIQLGAGMHIIKAEVARTPREHAIGLMFRTSMGSNEGMIFGFPRAEKQCFWMKNTLIPLSVAFVADDGRIVNLDEMLPQTENSHCSAEPVHFVLEMNKGWFTKHGIKAGDKLTGTPFDTK
jgi:uncharacterized membrane protein (UPF0127 family)